MTLLKPTLIIQRLIVLKNGNPVSDVLFHVGLNVLRGENSAGKTTIVRFVAFGLGAEGIEFTQEAQFCDEVFLEVLINDAVITLRRSVTESTQQPLSIFWGAIEQAKATAWGSGWQQFPFRRSDSKESFSQVLFRALEMPEFRGDSGSNITMHQLLRLIYSDQETPSAELFRQDSFDPAIIRAAVGDYLLGIDASELYDLRIREGVLEKDAAGIRQVNRTIYSTFGNAGTDISLDFLDERRNSLGGELQDLRQKLDAIAEKSAQSATASTEDERLGQDLNSVHLKISGLNERRIELQSEIADSELFLIELEERLHSIDESSIAESYLGTAIFSFCPSCFSPVNAAINKRGTCALCKSPVSENSARSQLARMRNELALQQRESASIREKQTDEIEQINRDIPALEGQLRSLEDEFKRNRAAWRSPQQILAQNLSKEIGRKEQEIKQFAELTKLAELLEQNNQKILTIEDKLRWIKGQIEAVTRQQTNRREVAYLAVAEHLQFFLKNDLERQTEFMSANEINIDFGANRVAIDGQSQFSASSMVYLRHSFHLAMLFASVEQSFFRYPRLVILDGIEDGGMEPERSFNFQRLIRDKSDALKVRHQIIVATAHIAPDLEDERYVAGARFTHDGKSLTFQR